MGALRVAAAAVEIPRNGPGTLGLSVPERWAGIGMTRDGSGKWRVDQVCPWLGLWIVDTKAGGVFTVNADVSEAILGPGGRV